MPNSPLENTRRLLPGLHSIRTRLMLWNTLTLALLFVAMDMALHLSVSTILMRAVDRDLRVHTQGIVDFPPPDLAEERRSARQRSARQRSTERRFDPTLSGNRPPVSGSGEPIYRPLVIDPQSQIVRPADARRVWDAASVRRALQGEVVYSIVSDSGVSLRILTRPFPASGPVQGVVQEPIPLTNNFRIVAALDRSLLFFFPATLLCAAVGSALLTRRALQQVRAFTQSAQQISAQDLSSRLPITGADEFAILADTFNAMIARLELSFAEKETLIESLRQTVAKQRRFTADASHELRTPLTAIKANTSLILSDKSGNPDKAADRAVLEDIDQAATAMAHLVDDLLILARSDEGQLGRNRRSVVLRELIETAVSLAASGTGETEIASIEIVMPDYPLMAHSNEAELIRLFTNLLSNAIHYTPPEGQIKVSASSGSGSLRIVIADSGIGIAPKHLKQLGERFFRVDSSRSRSGGGTGLGLSICQSIVNSHGGTLTFESSVGVGTTATVVLPAVSG